MQKISNIYVYTFMLEVVLRVGVYCCSTPVTHLDLPFFYSLWESSKPFSAALLSILEASLNEIRRSMLSWSKVCDPKDPIELFLFMIDFLFVDGCRAPLLLRVGELLGGGGGCCPLEPASLVKCKPVVLSMSKKDMALIAMALLSRPRARLSPACSSKEETFLCNEAISSRNVAINSSFSVIAIVNS